MGNKTSSPSTQPNNDKKDNKKNKKLNQKDINKIIIQLSDFEVLLNKKIAFVESQMDKELKNAKKHGKKNKRGKWYTNSYIIYFLFGYLQMSLYCLYFPCINW